MHSELERQWLHTLRLRWDELNQAYIDGRLRPPVFALDSATHRLGRWSAATRTIGISRCHIEKNTWSDVEDTLRHEMAHQIVSELFDAHAAAPHGPLFRRACHMLGMDNSPHFATELAPEHARVLTRIQKLLSLSRSSNPHEAHTAMVTANKLLLQHNLSLIDANDRTDTSWRFVGRALGRVSLAQKLTAGILQEFFFVRCVWVGTHNAYFKPVRKLEMFGRNHNLDMAEYVHDYLERTLQHLWRTYRQRTGAKGAALKNEFAIGVLTGLQEQLRLQRHRHEDAGLVWLGDPAVDELIDQRHGSLRRGRGGRYRVGKAHQAGREEGLKLQIRPGVGTGAVQSRGRTLSD